MSLEEGTIFIVLSLPQPWPPKELLNIFSKNEEGVSYILNVDTHGRFLLHLSEPNKAEKKYTFQPLIITGGRRVILNSSWSKEKISLHINTKELLLAEVAQGEKLVLETKSPPPISRRTSKKWLVQDLEIDEYERFFLETLNDLSSKLASGEQYQLIRAGGLVRQLLLDAMPLIHRINRNYHLPITFTTSDYTEKPPITPEIHYTNLDTSLFPDAKSIQNNLQDFLKAPCIVTGNARITVKDVIETCANAKGGVHLGGPKTDEQEKMLEFDKIISTLGGIPSLQTIASISYITLQSLEPLADAILKKAYTKT